MVARRTGGSASPPGGPSASLFLQRFLGAVGVLVGTAAHGLDLGRAGTGAVRRPSRHHGPGQLEGRAQRGPPRRGRAHPYPGQDPDPGPGRRAQQVGRLQDGLGVLAGLHAQGGYAGGAVALATVGGQEGQAHGVRDAAGAQTITWKTSKRRSMKAVRLRTPPCYPPGRSGGGLPLSVATCDRAWAYVAELRRVPGRQEGKKGPLGPTVLLMLQQQKLDSVKPGR